MKDASSAAIYGSRAAGGVILITTKRGSGAKTQINYDGYVTMDKVANKPDMLNASEWRDVNKQLGSDISQYDKYNADTDWFGALLRTGISQNHALSLSGGSSKSNYRASYTYLDRKGIARDTPSAFSCGKSTKTETSSFSSCLLPLQPYKKNKKSRKGTYFLYIILYVYFFSSKTTFST